ncbi:TonB-dependent receptor [Parabacteroides gordonii]|jgi:outer membrane receptor for ferrienterochelin and colicins|uniref:TonB-dependent receptor n=1 Tax=Parabacteroides gordonii TaxID=574930 RepID=UPI00241C4EE8|nr:TonB-dependent receptor [Parabacteroides gordonii]
MKKKVSLTALLCCMVVSMFAQISLSGKVVNAETNDPVVGANIRINHSLAGCTTNGKGEFTISNLPEGKHLLSVTHVSFLPQKYTANTGEKDILIKMTESYINLGQVVITGTGTHRRMSNSPVPIQVITAKDLGNANVTSLEDALVKLTPNVTTMTNGMGTTLSLNGMNEDYMLLLENGKRLTGDDRYTRINIGNVKRIEILSGAASALYGSDAIGGVINIITDDAKNTVNVSNYTHYTSKGRFSENINADINSGKFSSYTSYQRREADNWQVNELDENGYKTGRPMSTGFISDNISQRFAYNATDRLSFYVRGNYYNYNTRRPETATYFKKGKKKDEDGKPIYEETQAYTYNMLHDTYTYGAGAKYMINKSAYIDADFFADNYTSKYDYFLKSGDFERGDKETRKKTRYYNATVKGIFKPNSWNKVSTGIEYINENFSSESDNISFKNMYTFALFAQDEITILRDLQAVVGVRYLYNENFKNYATPNVALMYKIDHFNFRTSYATGYRAPTLSQLYATDEAKTASRYTIGNPNLKPEKSNFFSLNGEYTCLRFSITATGFYNDIKDMINYRVLSDEEIQQMGLGELHEQFSTIRQRDNVDRSKIKGISVNANFYLGAGLTLGGGYIYTDTEAKTLEHDSKTNKDVVVITPVDKSVKNAANVHARWDHDWNNYHLNVNLSGHIQGERYSSTYGYAPKYQQWDLNTRHTFNLDAFILEPGIGIENIFNKRDNRPWNSNFSTINPGRAVYVSLAVKFKK